MNNIAWCTAAMMKATSLCLVLGSGLAVASPSQGWDLRGCVAKVIGAGANDRIVGPNDPTYTDARMGESIQ